MNMSSGRGGKRIGAGRPVGARNHYNAAVAELLQKRVNELGHEDYDPVIAMAEIALNDEYPIKLRFKAHAEVAQYVRTKCRQPATQETVAVQLSPDARRRRIRELTDAVGL